MPIRILLADDHIMFRRPRPPGISPLHLQDLPDDLPSLYDISSRSRKGTAVSRGGETMSLKEATMRGVVAITLLLITLNSGLAVAATTGHDLVG
jgi:hypothetical protein